eukprot:202118_1
MNLEYSSILSIIYFSINFISLVALGLIVYQQGGHKVRSKSYFKDIWNQRKIYFPLIIHFYDTATDIGVMYNWYQLMQIEQEDPDMDYTSVDMRSFFWSGVVFLAVYRVCTLCFTLWEWLVDGGGEWYYVLLVLCDLYIFVAVYESFLAAQGTISQNVKRRQANTQRKKREQEEAKRKREEEAKKRKKAEQKRKKEEERKRRLEEKKTQLKESKRAKREEEARKREEANAKQAH